MILEERYRFIIDHAKGMALDAIWLYIEDDGKSYENRKDIFLWVFRRMVNEKIIVLAKNGSILNKNIDEVIREFSSAFPEKSEDLGNGVWFFSRSVSCRYWLDNARWGNLLGLVFASRMAAYLCKPTDFS